MSVRRRGAAGRGVEAPGMTTNRQTDRQREDGGAGGRVFSARLPSAPCPAGRIYRVLLHRGVVGFRCLRGGFGRHGIVSEILRNDLHAAHLSKGRADRPACGDPMQRPTPLFLFKALFLC